MSLSQEFDRSERQPATLVSEAAWHEREGARDAGDVPWIVVSDALVDFSDTSDPGGDWWGLRIALLVGVIWAAGLVAGFQASLALLTLLAFGCAVVGLRWRFLGLLGVGMLCVLDPLTRVYLMQGGLLRWNTLNYLLLGVAIAFYPRLLNRRDAPTRLLIALVVLIGVEMFLAPVWHHGIFSQLALIAPLGLLLYFLRADLNAARWYWFAVVNGTTGAMGGLMFYLHRGGLSHIDENALSYLPLTGMLSVGLGFHGAWTGRRQNVLLSLAAANAAWVFLTGSRGACLVALVCALYLVGEIRRPSRLIVRGAAAALMALLLVTMFSDLGERSLERVTKLFDSDRTLANRTSGRSDLALAAWELFQEHPFGVGSGGFPHYWSHRTRGAAAGGESGLMLAHSAWLKVLAENGLIGFLLFAAYVGSFAYVGSRSGDPRLRRLGWMTTAALAFGFIAQEFVVKGLWLTAVGAAVILHSGDESGDWEVEDAAA